MRDFIKLLTIGIAFFFAQSVYAESYKVLIIPDNIVTENVSLDSYIYDSAAEFFADEVAVLLNGTEYIKAPQISDIRELYKKDPSANLTAKNLTARFRNSYNIDYSAVKKLGAKSGAKYVLLMTSYIDAENYILRRTWWDFFNVAGASVIDPAYKISTYAALIDTEKNKKVWADTYYKTISTVENRIITRGPSPQTEQLSRIKDYSSYLCPQIAQHVQLNVLPPDIYAKESNQIDFDMGNIDNVFTKKYRHLGKEYDKIYNQKKTHTKEFINTKKEQYHDYKTRKAEEKLLKQQQQQQQTKLEVKATPVYTEKENYINNINNTKTFETSAVKNTVYTKIKETDTTLEPINIKKTKKNKLYEEPVFDHPKLRGYEF